MAAFGLDGALDDIRGPQKEPYGIHEDVAEIFELFQQCQGSWRVGLMGGLQGLVKSDVIAVAGAVEIKLDRESFALLSVCEAEFIRLYNRKHSKHDRRS